MPTAKVIVLVMKTWIILINGSMCFWEKEEEWLCAIRTYNDLRLTIEHYIDIMQISLMKGEKKEREREKWLLLMLLTRTSWFPCMYMSLLWKVFFSEFLLVTTFVQALMRMLDKAFKVAQLQAIRSLPDPRHQYLLFQELVTFYFTPNNYVFLWP